MRPVEGILSRVEHWVLRAPFLLLEGLGFIGLAWLFPLVLLSAISELVEARFMQIWPLLFIGLPTKKEREREKERDR